MSSHDPNPNVLLVEGNDDFHVVCALMQSYGVPESFSVIDCKGVDPLLERIPADILLRERLGIVIDADVRLEHRWNAVINSLSRSGYIDLPATPDPSGTVIAPQGKKPKVGVWLMPNNQVPGKLEDFIGFLVPHGNTLWQAAQTCVGQVPICAEKFEPKDTPKALIHTWLAWQRDPGIPMGWAISRKFLDANVAEAGTFVKWIHRLFL